MIESPLLTYLLFVDVVRVTLHAAMHASVIVPIIITHILRIIKESPDPEVDGSKAAFRPLSPER